MIGNALRIAITYDINDKHFFYKIFNTTLTNDHFDICICFKVNLYGKKSIYIHTLHEENVANMHIFICSIMRS